MAPHGEKGGRQGHTRNERTRGGGRPHALAPCTHALRAARCTLCTHALRSARCTLCTHALRSARYIVCTLYAPLSVPCARRRRCGARVCARPTSALCARFNGTFCAPSAHTRECARAQRPLSALRTFCDRSVHVLSKFYIRSARQRCCGLQARARFDHPSFDHAAGALDATSPNLVRTLQAQTVARSTPRLHALPAPCTCALRPSACAHRLLHALPAPSA